MLGESVAGNCGIWRRDVCVCGGVLQVVCVMWHWPEEKGTQNRGQGLGQLRPAQGLVLSRTSAYVMGWGAGICVCPREGVGRAVGVWVGGQSGVD